MIAYLRPAPIRWALAILWTAFTIFLLMLPSGGLPSLGWLGALQDAAMTGAHAVAFGIIALTWWWALTTLFTSTRAAVLAFVIVVILGIVTEWAQGALIVSRDASVGDFIADCIGALVMLIIVSRVKPPLA